MLRYDRVMQIIVSAFESEGLIDKTALDTLDENNPKAGDRLSDLIDKLSHVTIQMWNNQDTLYKIRHMSRDEFVATYGENISEIQNIVKRCCDLNVQRANLMDAIDLELLKIKKG